MRLHVIGCKISWPCHVFSPTYCSGLELHSQCSFLTKDLAFCVTTNFYIIGFLTGWSNFHMFLKTLFFKKSYQHIVV